jgi:hypothetical protein
MVNTRSRVSWFFTGVRLFLPLLPKFIWIALCKATESFIRHWRVSQRVVNRIAKEYMCDAVEADKHMHEVIGGGETISEYDAALYWVCYSIASFFYLLVWLAMSWATVEAFRLLVSAIF